MTATKIEQDYIAEKWVPSYYGLWFTVARNGRQDLSVKVTTLREARDEANKRNQVMA